MVGFCHAQKIGVGGKWGGRQAGRQAGSQPASQAARQGSREAFTSMWKAAVFMQSKSMQFDDFAWFSFVQFLHCRRNTMIRDTLLRAVAALKSNSLHTIPLKALPFNSGVNRSSR